jgi:hypothetical protein
MTLVQTGKSEPMPLVWAAAGLAVCAACLVAVALSTRREAPVVAA